MVIWCSKNEVENITALAKLSNGEVNKNYNYMHDLAQLYQVRGATFSVPDKEEAVQHGPLLNPQEA
jgi:hypothetical protein